MAKDVKIELDLKTRKAVQEVKKLAQETGKLDDDLDDVGTTGQRLAKAIEQSADDMIDEIDATKKAVDRLDTAFEGTDFDSREVVSDLKRLGLTADEIEADADELAAAFKRAGDVKVHAAKQGFDDVGQAVGGVRDETERTRDTMTGFVGGAVGELPLIGEAMGPLAEGLGQLTEGALEGEVNFKQLGTAALTMGLAAGGFMAVDAAMKSMAETDAFNEEQVDNFADAIKEVGDNVLAVDEALSEIGKVEGRAGGLGPFFEQTKDVTSALVDAGVTVEEFNRAIQRGGPDLDLVTGKLEAHHEALDTTENKLNLSGDALSDHLRKVALSGDAVEIVREKQEAYAKALEESGIKNDFFVATAESVDLTLQNITKNSDPIEHMRDTFDRMAITLATGTTPAVADVQMVMDELGVTQEEAIDMAIEHRAALIETETSLDGVGEAAEETADDIEELEDAFADLKGEMSDRSAYLDAVDGFDKVEQAGIAAYVAGAEGAEDAEKKARDYERAMIDIKNEVIDYAGEVGNIPDEAVSEILALIDEGKLAEAEAKLINLERTRNVPVRVSVTTEGGFRLPNGVVLRDRGGPVAPGETVMAGERRPEYVNGQLVTGPTLVNGPANITSGQQTASMGRSATVINNTTINLPSGTTPAGVVDAQRKYNKRNGIR